VAYAIFNAAAMVQLRVHLKWRPRGSFLPRREQQSPIVMDERDDYEKLQINKSTDMEIRGFHMKLAEFSQNGYSGRESDECQPENAPNANPIVKTPRERNCASETEIDFYVNI
jgi:hypothetical protein